MDTLYFSPLTTAIDLNPAIDMRDGVSLVGANSHDCSQNYTSGNKQLCSECTSLAICHCQIRVC